MLTLIDDLPFSIVPPALLLIGWIALRVTGRRTGWRFFLGGSAFAVLCVPAGMFIGTLEPPCDHPTPIWACGISVPLASGILGAFLAAGCLVGLLVLTAFLELFVPRPGDR